VLLLMLLVIVFFFLKGFIAYLFEVTKILYRHKLALRMA